MEKSARILWLDGLRGAACLGVVWHHFFLRYFPASYYGGQPAWADSLSQLPFWVLTNANFLLLLFFFVSGYVLSFQRPQGQNPLRLAAQRYLRLIGPLFLCCCATYLLYKAGLLTGFDFGPAVAPSLRRTLMGGLAGCLLWGDVTFSGAFWMLPQLFWAGLAGLLVLRLVPGRRAQAAVFAAAGLVCYLFISTYCAALLWGALAALALQSRVGRALTARPAAALLLLPGLFFGGYPSGRAPSNLYAALWRPATLPPGTTSALTFQLIGVALCFVGLAACPALQRLLEKPPLLALGRLSYAMYVLHVLVICQLSDLFYVPLCTALGQTAGAFALLALMHPVLLAAAWACTRLTDPLRRLLPGKR